MVLGALAATCWLGASWCRLCDDIDNGHDGIDCNLQIMIQLINVPNLWIDLNEWFISGEGLTD